MKRSAEAAQRFNGAVRSPSSSSRADSAIPTDETTKAAQRALPSGAWRRQGAPPRGSALVRRSHAAAGSAIQSLSVCGVRVQDAPPTARISFFRSVPFPTGTCCSLPLDAAWLLMCLRGVHGAVAAGPVDYSAADSAVAEAAAPVSGSQFSPVPPGNYEVTTLPTKLSLDLRGTRRADPILRSGQDPYPRHLLTLDPDRDSHPITLLPSLSGASIRG